MGRPRKNTKFNGYTHEQLGIPSVLHVGGDSIEIVLDPTLKTITKDKEPKTKIPTDQIVVDGPWGIAAYLEHRIYVWPGNKDYKPPIARVKKAFLHEVAHYVFRAMSLSPKDLAPNYKLHRNEHFISSFTETWLQVLKQLKDFTNSLEGLD